MAASAIPMSHLGERGMKSTLDRYIHNVSNTSWPAFNHSSSQDAEAEYDRLRELSRSEGDKKKSCFDRVRNMELSCFTR